MSKEVTYSVIIVNFNTASLTMQAVKSCYDFIDQNTFEVIVVDNGSTAGCIETALMHFPEILIIKSPENIGFGRANNLGYEHARGKFIFLLNSDAYLIDNKSVPLMVSYIKSHDDVAIVGPNFIKGDGTKNYAYGNLLGFRKSLNDIGIWKISKSRMENYATFKVCDTAVPKEVGYLGAAGILIKRSAIETNGLFDPNIFLYFEDMELGWRYRKKGLKSVIVPQATVVHLGGASSGVMSQQIKSLIEESKRYYVKKTLGKVNYLLLNCISRVANSLLKTKRLFRT